MDESQMNAPHVPDELRAELHTHLTHIVPQLPNMLGPGRSLYEHVKLMVSVPGGLSCHCDVLVLLATGDVPWNTIRILRGGRLHVPIKPGTRDCDEGIMCDGSR
jgi:hypothetical protein